MCCLFVLAMEPWSFFNALAASECSILCTTAVVLLVCELLGTSHFNSCLVRYRALRVVLAHMWVSWCVASLFWQWNHGRSSMRLQSVSVPLVAYAWLCHSLRIHWDLSFQFLLGPLSYIACCVAPHVGVMVCCLFVLAMEPWSFFNALAECECSFGCMSVVVSFFVEYLELLISMLAWSVAVHCLLCCTTCR